MSWFLVRGYPKDLIKTEMKKVKFTSKTTNAKGDESLTVIPFVMTYHPKLNSIKKVILKYLDLLSIWARKLKECLPLKRCEV